MTQASVRRTRNAVDVLERVLGMHAEKEFEFWRPIRASLLAHRFIRHALGESAPARSRTGE